MTTADFMKISSVNAKFTGQTESSKKLQDEELKVAEAFAGLMNQAAMLSNQSVDNVSSGMDVKVGSTQSAAESYERYSYKDNQIESAEAPNTDKQLAEASEDLETAEQEVMDTICEEYGVSEEEIRNVLDEMGLDVLDLLNPENLVNFIMQLTGIASSDELLLDENFLSVMGTMDALAEGLMKELNVDREGLQSLVNQMENVGEEMLQHDPNAQITEGDLLVAEMQMADGTEVLEVPEVPETSEVLERTEVPEASDESDASEGTVMKEDAEVSAHPVEAETSEDEIGIQAEKKDETSGIKTENADAEKIVAGKTTEQSDFFAENQGSEGNSLMNHNSNTENIVLNQSNAVMNNVADVTQTQFASYMSTDTIQIMEQIVNQMKVTLAPEVTSMEMQLNPENLGKVYVNISSEEGVINAQFRATNEIVKEALETQIATLRENLNQAGVKVDAIEVTIASHEFERNLEQNNHNPQESQETQNEQTAKRRNISVDSLDDLAGVMTEEETLVAQMMKDNGNSVDFTA